MFKLQAWPVVVAFVALLAALVALAISHVLPSSVVIPIVSGLVGWLLPSPAQPTQPATVPTIPPLLALVGLGLALHMLSACKSPIVAYTEDLADCEKAQDCPTYVLCRARAADAAGRPFTGYCVTDGGIQ